MNRSKIIVLIVLVFVLCGLGGLYLQSQSERSELQAMIKQQELEATIQKQQLELLQMRQNYGLPSGERASEPEAIPEQPSNQSAREQNLEEELARLKQEKQAVQEESALLNRKVFEQTDKKLKKVNQIVEARVVGKVDSYDKNANLLIFSAIGQPNLNNGQELAIRRKGAIFVLITLDELDPDSGVYIASVKRNELFDANEAETVKAGDEIIVPPVVADFNLPDLKTNALKTDLPDIPMDPA